jgi:hypothetical protein
MSPKPELAALQAQWETAWHPALALWSKFTRLRDPRWCLSVEEAESEGLTQSFAMIRLLDQTVVIDLDQIQRRQLQAYALEILGHEIGHHVFCPADLTDNARVLARMRWALPTKEHLAPLIANLYADLLVNDRLQRSAGLRVAEVYRIIGGGAGDPLWTLYMRIYEILWVLPKGTLATGAIDDRLEGDAQLGARLVRSYARDWLEGAGRFAALCLPYVLGEPSEELISILRALRDMAQAGKGGVPPGLTDIEDGEREGAIHPALDPELSGIEEGEAKEADSVTGPPVDAQRPIGSTGQYREPFEYGQILRALGLDLSDHEIAIRYYRERASPHLVRFPTRPMPKTGEVLPEGLEPWSLGSPLEDADWNESVLISPHVVPGVTTVQRVWGTEEDRLPVPEPLDLDLYVDSSGSMPDPQVNVSYAALAGVIVALSALRVGSRVQATLWSGARQFQSTAGFVEDQHRVMEVLTGYIGGGTAFPIHKLRETYATRRPSERPVHILIVSDSGVTTIFEKDERGESGLAVAQAALEKARGGGTMVLNIPPRYTDRLLDHAVAQGWNVDRVTTSEELVDFARSFSARRFGSPTAATGGR